MQLLQTGDRLLREGVVRELGERGTTPENESFSERLSCFDGLICRECCAAFFEQLSKAIDVELARCNAELVAVSAREQDAFAGAVEGLAEARDMDLNDLRGARRRFIRPELVDQAIARDDLVCVEKQKSQNGALLA